jgi:hypothetical protein
MARISRFHHQKRERERERERERDAYEASGVFQKQSLKVGYKEGSILFL